MILTVFLAAYILSQFFRTCLAIIAADLTRDLGLGSAELGNLSAIWFATFSLAQFPVGYMLDRHGPRLTQSLLMLAAVAGAVLFAYARNYAMALTGMGLIGIGCAPILMAALYYFGRTQPASRFAFYTSIMVGIGNIGNLLGAGPLAWSVAEIGWRNSMLVVAAFTAVSSALVFFLIKDPPRMQRHQQHGNAFAELMAIITIRPIWPVYALMFVSYAMIAAERGLWIGPFLEKVHGFDVLARGNAALLMAIGMALGGLVAGPLVDVVGTMKRVAIIGTLGAIGGFGALALLPHLGAAATIALLSFTGFFGMCYGILLSHARLFFPEHLLGRGVTFMNFLSLGGAGIALSLSGYFVRAREADHMPPVEIFSQLHLIFAGILLAALLYYLMAPEQPAAKPVNK